MLQKKSGAAGDATKPVKTKKKVNIKVIVIMFLVAVIAFAGVAYYYNFFEIKTKVITFFINQDTTYSVALADLEAQKSAATEQQTAVESQLKDIENRTKELDTREAALNEQDATASDATAAEDAKKADMAKMVVIYEGMDSAAASAILVNFTDTQWIADLLMQMDEKKAGKILAAMDTKLAATISALMVPK